MDADLNALIDEISELYQPEQQRVFDSSDEGEQVARLRWPTLREEVPVKDGVPVWPMARSVSTKDMPETSSERAPDSDESLDTESDGAVSRAPSAVFAPTVGPTGAPPRVPQHRGDCRRFSPQTIPTKTAQRPATVALGQRVPSHTTRQAPDASKTRPLIPDSHLASTAQLSPSKGLSPPAAPSCEFDLNAATTAAHQTPPSPSFTRERKRDLTV